MSRLVILVTLSTALVSTAQSQDLPRTEDVSSIAGVMKAYYEVVSAPANHPKQWARDRSLHHPEAQVVIIGQDQDGEPQINVMTLAEYHGPGDGSSATGFFEYEVNRVVQKHGKNVHVWSTYEWKQEENGSVGGRGVNSIQMVHDGSRYWITSWLFDGRSAAPPVEEAYLPEDRWEN